MERCPPSDRGSPGQFWMEGVGAHLLFYPNILELLHVLGPALGFTQVTDNISQGCRLQGAHE